MMRVPVVQPLPAELIDMIIDYIEVDVMIVDFGRPIERKHNCQCRGCDYKSIRHDEELLNFSQVCSSFRKRALPRLWSNFIISIDRFTVVDRLLTNTVEKRNIYLTHINQLLINQPSNLRNHDYDNPWWIWMDERKPFGIHVQSTGKEGTKYDRTDSFLLSKCVKWVLQGKIKYVDLISGPVVGQQYYEYKQLLPFWLCVANPRSNTTHSILFQALRQAIQKSSESMEGEWKYPEVKDSNHSLELLELRKRVKAEAIKLCNSRKRKGLAKRMDKSQITKVLVSFQMYPQVRVEVAKLLKNKWKPPKINSPGSQTLLPFWLRTSADGGDSGTFERLKIIAKMYDNKTLRNLTHRTIDYSIDFNGVHLPRKCVERNYLMSACNAINSSEILRKQVIAFRENGWKDPQGGESSAISNSEAKGRNEDDKVDDEDDDCVIM